MYGFYIRSCFTKGNLNLGKNWFCLKLKPIHSLHFQNCQWIYLYKLLCHLVVFTGKSPASLIPKISSVHLWKENK